MKRTTSWSERTRYALDNFLAKGNKPLFLSLVLFFVGGLAAISALRLVLNFIDPDADRTFWQHVYTVFLELTDPGNMNQDITTPPVFKLAAVIAGFTGVVLFSSLIAFLTTALGDALAHLKKGHSRVLEEGQTLILGWNDRVVEILNELVIANESERDAVVVVLADRPKEEMDEHLRAQFTDRRTTRLVTRSGAPSSLRALAHVGAEKARSAIVLATCGASAPTADKLVSDARVMQALLALVTHVGDESPIDAVAEVFDPRNRAVVEDLAPGHIVTLDAEEMLAKLIVQTSRTSGLSVVYSELLSFEGCELYFFEAPWGGATFEAAELRFVDGVPIGVRTRGGAVLVRPDPGRVLAIGEQLIVVARDDSSLAFRGAPVVIPRDLPLPARRLERRKERLLIIGWNDKAPIVIREYAEYVLAGSDVDILAAADAPAVAGAVASIEAGRERLSIRVLEKNPRVQAELESVAPFDYDTVLVLGSYAPDEADAERVDAESIVVLLHLRKLARALRAAGKTVRTKLITEVLVSANQELVSRAGVDDFIISNKMVSMIFAQLSQQPRMKDVYDSLFHEAGSEIYVKPVGLYFDALPATCRFVDLMRLAQKRGEVCIGYKLEALEAQGETSYGVSLVPPKDRSVTLSAGDALIVVAEDDR